MRMRTRLSIPASQAGSALLLVMLGIIVLLGITQAVVTLSMGSARAVGDAVDTEVAFQLAEAGLERGKAEIVDQGSPANIGTVVYSTNQGTISTTVRDLGGGLAEITSTGQSSAHTTTLRETVQAMTTTTGLPQGGISIVGNADIGNFNFGDSMSMIIDGGDNSAGITVGDPMLYNGLMEELTDAYYEGTVTESDITGSEYSSLEEGGPEFSVQQIDLEGSELLRNYETFYQDLVTRVDELSGTADKETLRVQRNVEQYTFGTAESPTLVHMDSDLSFGKGTTVSGHGVLIVSHELSLPWGSNFQWDGTVIVVSGNSSRSRFVTNGNVQINGNLVVLGEGNDNVAFHAYGSSKVNVDGTLFVGSRFDADIGKIAFVQNWGEINVNGLMMTSGSKTTIGLEPDSRTNINGMFQLGVKNTTTADILKFNFDGDLEIHRDDEMAQVGIDSLNEIGVEFNLTSGSSTTDFGSLETKAWYPVHDKGSY